MFWLQEAWILTEGMQLDDLPKKAFKALSDPGFSESCQPPSLDRSTFPQAAGAENVLHGLMSCLDYVLILPPEPADFLHVTRVPSAVKFLVNHAIESKPAGPHALCHRLSQSLFEKCWSGVCIGERGLFPLRCTG